MEDPIPDITARILASALLYRELAGEEGKQETKFAWQCMRDPVLSINLVLLLLDRPPFH